MEYEPVFDEEVRQKLLEIVIGSNTEAESLINKLREILQNQPESVVTVALEHAYMAVLLTSTMEKQGFDSFYRLEQYVDNVEKAFTEKALGGYPDEDHTELIRDAYHKSFSIAQSYW